MHYYLVNRIGTGTKADPYRPDIPVDTFVSIPVKDNQFIVGVNEILPGEASAPNVQTYCAENGISYVDILKWFVGDA